MTVIQTKPTRIAPETGLSRGEAVPEVTPDELREAVLGDGEVAIVDVREGDRYASGHVSVAVELPFSEIELRVRALLPRFGIPIIVTDDDGASLAPAAALRLRDIGYTDVSVLKGGLKAWSAQGNELITGLNSLSKALGEFVERHYHTPRITAEQLKARIDAGESLVILDTRPLDEFNFISIPGGIAAPGAELLYRAFDAAPSPTVPVVVNCAGRTRAIIGAQALLNAGFPNPVVSLENGTQAWLLAGYEPGRGATEQAPLPTGEGLKRARQAAAKIAARFGVTQIDKAKLDQFRFEQADRTLYLLDIRTREEYAAGHVPGSRSAPGGQVVQATDRFIGTRQGRVVLIDESDLVRSTITASWLIQLGLDHVYVYAAAAEERIESGPERIPAPGKTNASDVVSPHQLAALLDAGGAVVVDLEAAPPYFLERRYVPGSFVGRRSTLANHIDRVPGVGSIVLTSSDGALAALAAAELAGRFSRPILALAGGTDAWIAAGLHVQTGLDQPSLDPAEALPQIPTLDERRVNLAAYVHWGDIIVDQLSRDGLVRFRAFDY
jgi:rhodanese-related sulfurtransferase